MRYCIKSSQKTLQLQRWVRVPVVRECDAKCVSCGIISLTSNGRTVSQSDYIVDPGVAQF